jgi:hypothetical protein
MASFSTQRLPNAILTSVIFHCPSRQILDHCLEKGTSTSSHILPNYHTHHPPIRRYIAYTIQTVALCKLLIIYSRSSSYRSAICIRIQTVPQRKHNTSPLQRCCLGEILAVYSQNHVKPTQSFGKMHSY